MNASRPVFVLSGAPDAPADAVRWEDICHGQKGKRFLFVNHEPSRSPSRWTYADNKRPFIVYTQHWQKVGASSTLAGALKIARREAAFDIDSFMSATTAGRNRMLRAASAA